MGNIPARYTWGGHDVTVDDIRSLEWLFGKSKWEIPILWDYLAEIGLSPYLLGSCRIVYELRLTRLRSRVRDLFCGSALRCVETALPLTE